MPKAALGALLKPERVVLVGASSKPGSVGNHLLANLLSSGFPGTVYAVNPHPVTAAGAQWLSDVSRLPRGVELAIVATPAATVPDILDKLGAQGTRVAIVVSSGITQENGLRRRMLDAARPHGLRIIGPNCLGVLIPPAGLNAAFARNRASPGGLALISQSGAVATALLDWASARGLGFSGVVSVGNMADVDIGDLVELFGADERTHAILIYVEGLTDPAKFVAAARTVSAHKPVIAIKAGRSIGAGKAVHSHTGAMIGNYDVYQAVFRRAGVIAVDTLTGLFDAAETLGTLPLPAGERVAIVSNGGGAGILAVDALLAAGAQLADLSDETLQRLQQALPGCASLGNPLDLGGDTRPDNYRSALEAMLADPAKDSVVVLHCPTALADGRETAEMVAAARREANAERVPLLGCWLGDLNAAAAQPVLSKAGIPLFATPEDAIRGIGYLAAARKGPALARRVATAKGGRPPRAEVPALFARCRREGRDWLNEVEAKELLALFGIPVVPTRLARSPEQVRDAALALQPPYAVKIVSPDILHKSDVGGVALDLPDAAAAADAARAMVDRIKTELPTARIAGLAVETMVRRPGAHELIAGISVDSLFGPVLMIGAGGKAAEVIGDRALDLPPLDAELARAMIHRTRISRLLSGYRDEPAVDMDALCATLVALSEMAELADIRELDANPLLVGPDGVIALDARVRISPEPGGDSRMIIGN